MDTFRKAPIKEINGLNVVAVEDYLTSQRQEGLTETLIDLPKSNVIKYYLEDGSWFCLRPSGTEPKAKFYFSVNSPSLEESSSKLEALKTGVMEQVNAVIDGYNK